MPIYEYICEEDGTRIELMRPMVEADAPVPDPEGKGRVFKRAISAPNAKTASAAGAGGSVSLGACCPCGKPGGGCAGGRA
jgi:putative FmdB family regulatory protein